MVGSPGVGDVCSVDIYFCFRTPDLRRRDEEVDELIGLDVTTTRGTSVCTSEKKSVQEALHVNHVTAEVRRVTLKSSNISLEIEEPRSGRAGSINVNYAPQVR